jgi:outer membrane protein assembly factor BamB
MSRPPGRLRKVLAWTSLALVVLGLGVGAVLLLNGGPGNVFDPKVEFDTAPPTAPPTFHSRKSRDAFDDGFEWPVYGFTKARTRYLPVRRQLRPPFVIRWKETGRILLEFPPVLCGGQLFLLKNNGALYGISRRTGRVRWKRKLGYLAAASPACSHGTVYAVLLQRVRAKRAGRVVAVRARNGRTRWSRKLPSRAESSPLLDRGSLYFGTEDGTVYGLRAKDGFVRWRAKASGAVKGGLAMDGGKLFFGDYGGRVTAVRSRDGRKVWKAGSAGTNLGLSSGNFYSTPSVAFGRVYIGNTDGFIYSYSARNGRLAWRHKTGSYVYASPAVSPAGGGTVYAGSYDGRLYALDARSGRVRWTRRTGGKLSGGPVVVGDLVFYANLGRKSTGAVGASTGKLIWSTGRGAFDPLISDGRRLYLVGYSSLFMLEPKAAGTKAKPRPKPKRKAKPEVPLARNPNHLRRAHGHHHTGHGPPPRCHRHRHRVHRRGKVIVFTHAHCHRHVPGVRRR